MVLAPSKLTPIDTALIGQDEETIPGQQTGLQSLLYPRNWGDLLDLTGMMVVRDEISVPIEKKRRG